MMIGVSFRSVRKIFVELNIIYQLNTHAPTHTAVLNRVKKKSTGNFQKKDFFNRNKWVLIVDESIQFGNNKLLLVIATPEPAKNQTKALTYEDFVPLILKVSSSWKSEDIAKEIREQIDTDQIAYIISDNGSNLLNSFKALNVMYIEDINHKFSWIMQRVLNSNDTFLSYTKHLSDMRAKLSMSKFARLVPPNQRIMSRYMNLTPLFSWGIKIIHLLNNNELSEEETDKVSFIKDYQDFIEEMDELLRTLNEIQKIMKNTGFNKKNVNCSEALLRPLRKNISAKVSKMISEYFKNTLSKMEKKETVYCSSDMAESCFGKYKELVKNNKSVGISDLALSIAALLGKNNLSDIKTAMEKVSVKKIKSVRDENIGDTLLAQKRNLFKNIG